jgi:hypothetical protein
MPRLRFHAVEHDKVKAASKGLAKDLAEILNIGPEHFFLECMSSNFIYDGEDVTSFPFIEVHCFDRGTEAFDRMAKVITQHMLAAGCQSVDVAFILMQRRHYYEDGEHL